MAPSRGSPAGGRRLWRSRSRVRILPCTSPYGQPMRLRSIPSPAARRRPWLALPLTAALVAAALLPGAARADGRTAAARQLVRTERALATVSRAGQAPGAGLDPRSAAARPFWAALRRLSGALDHADAGLRAGDATYFAALGEGTRALSEIEAVWARTRHRDPAVDAAVDALSTAYRRLRDGYGWEAYRRAQGGALGQGEAARFRALRRADARVAARLKAVAARAARAGDRAMAAELLRLRGQAERIVTAEMTLEAYLTAQLINDIVLGEWAASQQYVKPAYRTAWRQAAPTVEKLSTDPNIGFFFTADLSQAKAWTFDDGSGTPPTDDTPVDEVEIVDARPHATEGGAAGAPAASASAPSTAATPDDSSTADGQAGTAPADPARSAQPVNQARPIEPASPSASGEPAAQADPGAQANPGDEPDAEAGAANDPDASADPSAADPGATEPPASGDPRTEAPEPPDAAPADGGPAEPAKPSPPPDAGGSPAVQADPTALSADPGAGAEPAAEDDPGDDSGSTAGSAPPADPEPPPAQPFIHS